MLPGYGRPICIDHRRVFRTRMSQSGLDDELDERRLPAILAANVAGHSRLLGADDEGSLRALMAHRKKVVDPIIANYRGRIVKITANDVLMQFARAVDATRHVVDAQSGMPSATRRLPPRPRIR
jgi:class 3 adenylate cyclase